MVLSYYKININETAANNPKEALEKSELFNVISEQRLTKGEVREYLRERYGAKFNLQSKRGVYVDGKNGEAKQTGVLYSYWNKDISHNSKSWYQTDWIEISLIKEDRQPILNLNN